MKPDFETARPSLALPTFAVFPTSAVSACYRAVVGEPRRIGDATDDVVAMPGVLKLSLGVVPVGGKLDDVPLGCYAAVLKGGRKFILVESAR